MGFYFHKCLKMSCEGLMKKTTLNDESSWLMSEVEKRIVPPSFEETPITSKMEFMFYIYYGKFRTSECIAEDYYFS
jgi:hypothetical protein